jgi:hypothetical protein
MGDVALKAPPLVVVAQVGHEMVPDVVIGPPDKGPLVATLVTVPLPPPVALMTPPDAVIVLPSTSTIPNWLLLAF